MRAVVCAIGFLASLHVSHAQSNQQPSLIEAGLFLLTQQEELPKAGNRTILGKEDKQRGTITKYAVAGTECKVRIFEIEMNQFVKAGDEYRAVAHSVGGIEYDFSQLATEAKVDLGRNGNPLITISAGPSFCSILRPKNYQPFEYEISKSWPLFYEPVTPPWSASGSWFYLEGYTTTQQEFGLVQRVWPHGTTDRVWNKLISSYKSKLSQDFEDVARRAELLDYERRPCPSGNLTPVTELTLTGLRLSPAASTLSELREKQQRLMSARKYIAEKFSCVMPPSVSSKPY